MKYATWVRLFKRVKITDKQLESISHSTEDYQRGYWDGFRAGREDQRTADLQTVINKES